MWLDQISTRWCLFSTCLGSQRQLSSTTVLVGSPPSAGIIAGLATALSGSMLIYEHVILTESFFTFLIVTVMWLLIVGMADRSWIKVALAGAVASLSAMIRPVGLTLAIVMPVMIFWLAPRREGLKLAFAFATAFGVIMAPWVLHNALVHGEAEVVHPGRFLIERTIRNNPPGVSMYSGPDHEGDSRSIRAGRAILRSIDRSVRLPSRLTAHSSGA